MAAKYLYNVDDNMVNAYREMRANVISSSSRGKTYDSLTDLFDSTAHFWLNDEPGEYPLHWHPTIEMIIPLENNYTVVIEHKAYELTPGDIFMIPNGKLHHLVAPPEGLRMILIFDFNMLSGITGFSDLIPWLSQPILINRDTCAPIYEEEAGLISQLLSDYLCKDTLREIVIYTKLITFFTNYARYQLSLNQTVYVASVEKRARTNHINAFNTVIQYLDSHYTEDIPLEKAAKIAGFSKYHFSRLFKQFTGYNFYDYLMYKRIKLSEMLLSQPDSHITEIALQCGFSSLSTFNRTFKKIKGCTPSECRKLIEG